jgi:hypothetical protein
MRPGGIPPLRYGDTRDYKSPVFVRDTDRPVSFCDTRQRTSPRGQFCVGMMAACQVRREEVDVHIRKLQ